MSRPTQIISGDTYEWNVGSTDYPASDGWALKVTYSNATVRKQITAATSTDGVTYDVILASTDSDDLTAGTYAVVETVEKGSGATLERHTLASYQAVVTANLAGASAATDARTMARKMLDAIEVTILASFGKDALNMSIAARSIGYRTWDEMMQARDRLKREVSDEEAVQKAAMGQATGRNYHIRFV